MRKLAGVLCAAAVALPAPFLAEPASAAAAGGVSCKALKGTEVWNPPLPKRDAPKVKPTITIRNAKLGNCTGGGGEIASGSFRATIKWLDPGNCNSLTTHTPGEAEPRIKGTVTIDWNTGKASTVAVSLRKTKPYVQKLNGTVTGGKFAGSKFAVMLLIDPPEGACDAKPLSRVKFARLTTLVISSER